MGGALTLAGALCVCAGTGGWGYLLARQVQRHPRDLAATQGALEALRTEIVYAATPLPQALRRVGTARGGPAAALCQTAADHLERGSGVSAAEAWAEALRVADAQGAWDAGDVAALGQLGQALGASGREDQARHIAACLARLRQAEAAARVGAEARARMWLYLGVLAGAALVLLLL